MPRCRAGLELTSNLLRVYDVIVMGVIADDRIREAYDRTWCMYPWQHPACYWLRSDGHVIICTRCSVRYTPSLGDVEHEATAFCEKHARCEMDLGDKKLRLGHVPPHVEADPIFG